MKSDVRKWVTDCAACQLLKAKRARAHRHFRAKLFCTPRTTWAFDFYGVENSVKNYNNILGGIDLATAECRLFPTKGRAASTVTECILQGIVLRDGCPLRIHSDAAREFISKGMNALCTLLGCKQTTTLAHHPTGNAAIERLWQWIALCLKQMTKEQYQAWEEFVRLMEHVWNTSHHSVLGSTPFEAAHGLPARGILETWVEQEAEEGKVMSEDGLAAMKETARAFVRHLRNVRQEAASRNAELLRKGRAAKYKVGDEVSFFIPPSEKEAKRMGRKPKHLLQYRGPAIVVKVLSNTTYELEFDGRTYYRNYSELRPYKASLIPIDLPIANDVRMQEREIIVGNYVALCDSNRAEDDQFHLCLVSGIEDGKAILLNYATWSGNIKRARFKIMYQEESTLKYTTDKPKRRAVQQEVIDKVPLEDADEYIDHYDIQMTEAMRISAKSIRQLKNLGLKHHVLGKTFPK